MQIKLEFFYAGQYSREIIFCNILIKLYEFKFWKNNQPLLGGGGGGGLYITRYWIALKVMNPGL